MQLTETQKSWLIVGVAVFASCLVSAAKADPYFIGSVGNAHTIRTTNTSGESAAWTQSCCDSVINNKSGVYSLGLGYDWLYGAVELRYHDAGTYSQFGSWKYFDDGTDTGTVNYGYGHTHVTGTSLAGIAHYRIKNFSLGLEAGIWKWQARWRESVVTSGSTTFSEYGMVKPRGVSPIVGAILGYKNFEFRYEMLHVEPRDGDFSSITQANLVYRLYF